MVRVKLEPLGLSITVHEQEPLLQSLQRAKVELAAVCGGEGTCGTCALQVFAGGNALTPMQTLERSTLKNIRKDPASYRLTCQTCATGQEVVFYLSDRAAKKLTQIVRRLENRLAPRDMYHPLTGKLLVKEGQLITRLVLEQLLSTG
jgi:ferredoxin